MILHDSTQYEDILVYMATAGWQLCVCGHCWLAAGWLYEYSMEYREKSVD
eukprot:COSAG01_NODE_5136_length_4460_cov_2.629901_1_plen_50_part_00